VSNANAAHHLPNDWSLTPLAKLVPPKRPIVYGIVQAGPHVPSGIPYIRSTDVGDVIEPFRLRRASKEIAAQYQRSEVQPGDIVFSLRGNIGATSKVPNDLPLANLTQGTARISVNGLYCTDYVRYALAGRQVMRRINAVAKGSTFLEISLHSLRQIAIPTPPLQEQRQITSILSTWDHAIARTEKLIEAKRKLKKGLMQRLLSGKRRFTGFDQTWKQATLGRLFAERNERNRVDLPLLSVTRDLGVVRHEATGRKDSSAEDKSRYKRICPGDIGYNTMRMWQGVSALARAEGIISPAYTVCVPGQAIDASFAAYLFKFPAVIHLFHRYSQGLVSDTLNLKFPNFAQIQVEIPSKKEQRCITKVFESADRDIDRWGCTLRLLQTQKRGLMQQLLTGRVRIRA